MPEFWMPAWLRVEASSREDALARITELWPDEGQAAVVDDGVDVLVMTDDDEIEEGALLADEEEREDYLRRWGFGPPVAATPEGTDV
jgi:hypothetical protein